MHLLWVPKGEYGIKLAKQIATLFEHGFYLDHDKISKGSLIYLVAQAEKQKITFVVMCKAPLAMQKELGGKVFMAYGTRAQAREDLFSYQPKNVKNELSKTVEALMEELKLKKLVKGP